MRGARSHDTRGPIAGYTVVELLVVIVATGVVLSIAIPRAQLTLDRVSVHSAAREVISTIQAARMLALAAHQAVAVDVMAGAGALRVRRGDEVVVTKDISQTHAVSLAASRDSMAYDAHGLGHGAANLSVVIRRRAAAETVFVSRLGRVR